MSLLDSNQLAAVEAVLRGLLSGQHASLSLSFNDHASNYVSAAQWLDEPSYPKGKFVSPDEKAKARATNCIWELQWYPDTPVGFYRIAASSLTALLEHVAATSSMEAK